MNIIYEFNVCSIVPQKWLNYLDMFVLRRFHTESENATVGERKKSAAGLVAGRVLDTPAHLKSRSSGDAPSRGRCQDSWKSQPKKFYDYCVLDSRQ